MSSPTLDSRPVEDWLPPGKRAAVCFSIDDVHPATSQDPYEAGGDLERGALGHLVWLLKRHPQLRTTLFVTPDWRMISGFPTRRWLARLPGVRHLAYLVRRHPLHTMRLDRHPEFVAFLRSLPRTELALHGLHHVRRGQPIHVEFLGRGQRRCRRELEAGIAIFRRAGVPLSPGLQPPGWDLSPELAGAAGQAGLRFIVSARDLETPITAGARTAGSGLAGAPLFHPAILPNSGLIHFSTNYQATSRAERAHAILEAGGLLAIKAHIAKRVVDHVLADGLDAAYREQLHRLFSELEDRHQEHLAWTSFGELSGSITEASKR